MTDTYRFKRVTTPGAKRLKAAASQPPAQSDVRLAVTYGTTGQTGTLDITADNLTDAIVYSLVRPLVL